MTIRRIPYQQTWEIRHEVLWPNQPIDHVKLSTDPDGWHFGLFVNDRLVAVVSAFVTDKEAQFRKFATREAEQGKGYGTQLLDHLIEELRVGGVTNIWCNARLDKTYFYERFGLTRTTERFSKGGIDYVIMRGEV
ncbi:MAG: GNAT family N-acetyltransferase [Bacteroidota bacterium]